MHCSVSRFGFGYVIGLISVSKGDLPPFRWRRKFGRVSCFLRMFRVSFDARSMSRFPTYAQST